jgi:hypothetical protein
MLYLISGTSRSGKTLIVRKLMKEYQIPYLSTDWLMMGFNDGIPEYGIHHLLWPNEIAKKMWPFLSGMIDNMLFDGMDYVIEGEAMLPELIAELVNEHTNKLKAVFVGYADINVVDKVKLVKEHCDRDDDWLISESDEYIKDHIGNMIGYSKMIKEQCEKHNLPYFDTSKDFEKAVN